MKESDAVLLLNESVDNIEAENVINEFLKNKAKECFENVTGYSLHRWTYPYQIVFELDNEIDGFVEVKAKDMLKAGSSSLVEKTWVFPKNILWD